MATLDEIFELLEPVVTERGLELVDIERPGGTLRVVVDRPGGIDLDTVGTVSRDVSLVLDERQAVEGRYTLEVTSPGVERTLRTPRHFGRALGEEVSIKTVGDVDGRRRFRGELVDVDDSTVVLRTDDGDERFSFDDIRSARTVFEWGPTPKPGGRGQRSDEGKAKAGHGEKRASAR